MEDGTNVTHNPKVVCLNIHMFISLASVSLHHDCGEKEELKTYRRTPVDKRFGLSFWFLFSWVTSLNMSNVKTYVFRVLSHLLLIFSHSVTVGNVRGSGRH